MNKLYKATLSENNKGLNAYAWIDPQGNCFTSRDVVPYGWLKMNANDAFKDLTVKELTSEYGFKKVSTKMTQEQLANGWLC